MEWEGFEGKLSRWRQISKNSAWLRASSEPPIFKLLWKFKIQVPPPHFVNPFLMAPVSGLLFGGMLFLFFRLAAPAGAIDEKWPLFVLGGFLFGVSVSSVFWIERRVRKLPKWEDL